MTKKQLVIVQITALVINCIALSLNMINLNILQNIEAQYSQKVVNQ